MDALPWRRHRSTASSNNGSLSSSSISSHIGTCFNGIPDGMTPAGPAAVAGYVSAVSEKPCQYVTRRWISLSETNTPCRRTGAGASGAWKSISPRPNKRSAPGWSRMTRLSTPEATANAMRAGKLALINPVTTSTEGRWVEITKWMPVARANWAKRVMVRSVSSGAIIIRSANSSTMTTR